MDCDIINNMGRPDIISKSIPGFQYLRSNHVYGAKIVSHRNSEMKDLPVYTQTIPGKSFIYNVSGMGFFHSYEDNLAEFLTLKKAYPELQFVAWYPINMKSQIEKQSPHVHQIIQMVNPNVELDEELGYEYIFEEIIFMTSSFNFVLTDKVGIPTLKTPQDPQTEMFKEYSLNAMLMLREFIIPKINKDIPAQKLFISRKKEHAKIRELLFEVPPNLKGEDLEQFYQQRNVVRADYEKRYRKRYIELEDELEVESYFKRMGYHIIDFNDYTLLDQAALAYSCTHMAGFAGAGLYNALFMNESAHLAILATCNEYEFYHKDIHKLRMKNVIEYPVYDTKASLAEKSEEYKHLSRKWSAKELIKYTETIQENFGFF